MRTPWRLAAQSNAKNVLVLGASGTIGKATVAALLAHGHTVTSICRPATAAQMVNSMTDGPRGNRTTVRVADVTDLHSLTQQGIGGDRFDAIVSCLASRTGGSEDAWAIDCEAHRTALAAARAAGIRQFVLLSAICVQKPLLAFQHAKLAFEADLKASGLTYSIVRPTAYFKSLSGQVQRVKDGKPFLMFGNGALTACKPISDADLGDFIARCLSDPDKQNAILPVGGPGPAITPREQGEFLFARLGKKPRFKHVPVAMLDVIAAGLAGAGLLVPAARRKAELARIGRYYATESMLVLDPKTGRYDAEATPSHGSETLFSFYERLLRDEVTVDRGEHAVF
ncbi:MAG: NAD(P)H-binding protein [Roseibium sp.]|nr:NAD(P)H-binding protein [Roseibium sp.]